MRYFVTGGSGFIGANFVEQLLITDDGTLEQVTIFDKLTYAGNPKNLQHSVSDPRVSLIVGDICDHESLTRQMMNHDLVVHFAAESHVDRSINSAAPFFETNVLGTLNVLESARDTGVKTVIHVSTDEVYGSLQVGSADESFPLLPNSPYAASKAASDLVVRSYYKTHKMDIRITRCANNYGKYQFPEKFIPVVISAALNGDEIPVYGDGKNIREWIHVVEHCKAILAVIKKGAPGEIYNIGSGFFLSNIELAQKICHLMNAPKTQISYVKDRKGHDFRYSLNSKKISNIYKSIDPDFDNYLTETIEWYKNHQNWWDLK
jgi:dTDP-glucose 4,6-dehydratase